MLRWHIEEKQLHLRYTWKISRNSSDTKANLFIRVADSKHVGIGEAAPNIRYGETAEILTHQFELLIEHGLELIRSLEDLHILLQLYPPANAQRGFYHAADHGFKPMLTGFLQNIPAV